MIEDKPKTLTFEDTPVIAAVAVKKVSESRQRFDQVVQREIQDAVERKQFEVVTAMAKLGIPINEFPDTKEGAVQLHKWMEDHDVQIQKFVYEDDFRKSGTYFYWAGIEVAFVPCEIVRGVMV